MSAGVMVGGVGGGEWTWMSDGSSSSCCFDLGDLVRVVDNVRCDATCVTLAS